MTANENSQRALEICQSVNVIPVLIVEEVAHAAPLAEALSSGGLGVLEVTLRTPMALDVISEMAALNMATIGAGTLLTPADVKAAKAAGAKFGVAPGATDAVLQAAIDEDLPLLPGAVTATEIMNLNARGFQMLKFFPAELAGGAKMLKAFSSPFQGIQFCPTGGIKRDTARSYLSLPNVVCVGGSWIADPDLVRAGDWGRIAVLASEASQI